MIAFDWNGLRVGDRVLVHVDDGDLQLRPGKVANVDAATRWHKVGIRLSEDGGSVAAVVWPSRVQVHRDPRVASERCWRCELLPAARLPA